MRRSIARRSFVGTLIVLGGGLTASCAAPATAPQQPTVAPPIVPTSPPASPVPTTVATPPKATQAAPTAAPTQVKAPAKMKLGIIRPSLTTAYARYGQEKGFYQDEALDVEVVVIDNDATAIKALIAGEVDVNDSSPGGTFSSIEKGAGLKIVGGLWPTIQFVFYAKKEINTLADIYGKDVATSGPGSLPDVMLQIAMKKEGLDISRVNRVTVPGSGLVPAIVAGKVAAVPAPGDQQPLIAGNPDIKVLFNFKDVVPNYARGCLITSDRFIAEKPDVLTRFLTASTRAFRYEIDHPQETVERASKWLGLEPGALEFAIKWYSDNQIFNPNLYVSPEAVMFTQQVNVDVGNQSKVLPVEQVATWEFQKRVIATIGEYKKP